MNNIAVPDLSKLVQVSRCHGAATEEFHGRKKNWVLHRCVQCRQQCAVVSSSQYEMRLNEGAFRREIDVWMDDVQKWGSKRREIEARIRGLIHLPWERREELQEKFLQERRTAVSHLDRLQDIGVQKGWIRR